MKSHLRHLLERQERLIATSAEQRAALATSFQAWEKPLSWFDRGMNAAQLLQKNRLFLYAAFALLASYKPAGARKVVVFAVSALKIAHHVRDLIVPKSKKQ